MTFYLIIVVLFVFGVLFRLGARASRAGFLIWLIPFVLQAILRMGHVTEADAFRSFYLLIFALGALLCGACIRAHKFLRARH